VRGSDTSMSRTMKISLIANARAWAAEAKPKTARQNEVLVVHTPRGWGVKTEECRNSITEQEMSRAKKEPYEGRIRDIRRGGRGRGDGPWGEGGGH